MVHPQKDKIVSYLLFILFSGPRKGGTYVGRIVIWSFDLDQIWCVTVSDTLWSTLKKEGCVVSIIYSIEWTAKGGGGVGWIVIWNC